MSVVPLFDTPPSNRLSLSKHHLSLLAACCCFAVTLAAGCALAQQSSAADQVASPTGGSAVLPVPQPQFGGVIGRKANESKPDFPKAVTAPKGAPNVLLIMTDDTGFGAASTFGGPIPTPNLDRVAKSGLSYNQFHTTALCSPDAGRAADRPQPPHRRHGQHHGVRHGISGLHLDHSQERRHDRQHSRRQRLQHGVVRQAPPGSRVDARPWRALRPVGRRA